jgi:hypothetical protein
MDALLLQYLVHSLITVSVLLVLYVMYQTLIAPNFNPLRRLCGPPVNSWFGNHLAAVLEYVCCRLSSCVRSSSDSS